MKIRKFNDHPYAQAKIHEYSDGSKVLVSYSTPVVEIDAEGWLHVNGLYSMTTIRHIGWFMKELGLDYQLAKRMYINRMEYNLYTGEIIHWR